MLKKFCFGIGIFDILTSIAFALYTIIEITTLISWAAELSEDPELSEDARREMRQAYYQLISGGPILITFVVIGCIIVIAVASILIYAVKKKKHNLLLPWMIVIGLGSIVLGIVIACLLVMRAVASSSGLDLTEEVEYNPLLSSTLNFIGLFVVGLHACFWGVVFSYFAKMRKENMYGHGGAVLTQPQYGYSTGGSTVHYVPPVSNTVQYGFPNNAAANYPRAQNSYVPVNNNATESSVPLARLENFSEKS